MLIDRVNGTVVGHGKNFGLRCRGLSDTVKNTFKKQQLAKKCYDLLKYNIFVYLNNTMKHFTFNLIKNQTQISNHSLDVNNSVVYPIPKILPYTHADNVIYTDIIAILLKTINYNEYIVRFHIIFFFMNF